MQFKIQKRQNENLHKYPTEDIRTAHNFSNKLKRELGDFLIAVIVFGSAARRTASPRSDIDVLVIGDDMSFKLTSELTEAYRLITEKVIMGTSKKLHVTSMTFSSFWEYVKTGDPVAVNILRDGIALYDTGFFNPLQVLLKEGRIRPTEESVWTYFSRAPRTINNSRWHILQATLDLYWAVIDSAHAALMRAGTVPTTPEHVPEVMHEQLVKTRKIEAKYVSIMKKFYNLMKSITHREIKTVTGTEYDKYLAEAQDFVERMKKYIEKG